MQDIFLDLASDFASPEKPKEPAEWAKQIAGYNLWSKQQEILDSVSKNKMTAVQSAHGTGKSLLASVLAAWWIDTHPWDDCFVISTAPSKNQVHGILWENIRQIHKKAELPGVVQLSDNWVINGTLVAQGRKPADYTEHAFQGIHRKYVLFILDEACGINKWIWTSAITNTSSEHCRVLAIGNPDDPTSEFARVCRPGSGWNNIKISLWDSPNFTGEEVSASAKEHLVDDTYLQTARAEWGESSPIWRSKVDGEFPENDEFSVIPIGWYLAAVERWHMFNDIPVSEEPGPPVRRIFGVDVARYGTDKTVIATRLNGIITEVDEYTMKDNVETANIVASKMSKRYDKAVIDMSGGYGSGVYDILKSRGYKVEGFNAGARTKQTDATGKLGFTRIRSAGWWKLRELLDPGKGSTIALPPVEKLQGDLTAPKFEQKLDDKIQVEPKDDLRKRLGRSTDYGDAVVMAFWSKSVEITELNEASFKWDNAGAIEGGAVSWDLDDDWREKLYDSSYEWQW
jgi:hypothetical protein